MQTIYLLQVYAKLFSKLFILLSPFIQNIALLFLNIREF